MMFDVGDDCPVDEFGLQLMQDDLDMSITVKAKARHGNMAVIIKTQVGNTQKQHCLDYLWRSTPAYFKQEQNAAALCRARAILLGLGEDKVLKAGIPDSYGVQPTSLRNPCEEDKFIGNEKIPN